MADVKYVVTVDSSGAVKQIEALDKAWVTLNKTQDEGTGVAERSEKAHGSLWKQMAVGQLVAQAAMRAWHAFTQGVKSSIQAAIQQEDAENRLKTALETTGRSIEGNMEAYKAFAAEKQKLTKYGDEEVMQAQALLLQMTNLDQKGIRKAIEGAMGLSAVMGIDLQSAILMVTKAMEGNYATLQRVGITVSENLTPQEKQAELLQKLGALYPRAGAELKTFGGSVKQLSNYWGDVKEALGGAIAGNEDVRTSAKTMAEGLKKVVESDRFKLWLSSLTDVISAVIKGVGGIGKAVVDLENKLFGAKGWEKYIDEQTRLNSLILEGVNIHALRRRAIEAGIVSIKEWGKAYKEAGGNTKAMYDAIKAGVLGPEMKALFESMKLGAEEAAAAAAGAKPPINETGDALAIAAKHAAELKDELKLVFRADIQAQIDKYREALRLLGKDLTPAGVADLQAKIAELEKQMGSAATEAQKVDAVWTSLGVKTIPAQAEATRILELALKRLNDEYKAGRIDVLEYERQTDALNKKLEESRVLVEQKLPPANEKFIDLVLRNVPKMDAAWGKMAKSAAEKMHDFGEETSKVMDEIQLVWGSAQEGLNKVFAQAQTNRMIAIENEYKKRLNVINRTIKDEDKKQAAITALEAEFQIKRTQAQAAGAKQAKAVALMEAVVNTASGVTRALKDYIFPLSTVIAGIVGALGAVQIALIARQPIPLARGAVFRERQLMSTSKGATFEVAEEEPEYLVPEKHLRALAARGPSGFFTPQPALAADRTMHIHIHSPLIQTTGLSNADLAAAGEQLFQIIERQARRRGRW